MIKEYLEAVKKSEKKKRICMFNSCQDTAIRSHVLQKNGILRDISIDNHLVEHVASNPFEMETKGISDFKRIGVNNVYTFCGFCQHHDTEIFKPIESDTILNFDIPNQQALFCYRGLCQEIRRKEIALERISGIRNAFPSESLYLLDSLFDGYEIGIRNLNYFKSELENCIVKKNYSKFYFETLKIPRIDLCISVPLNVGEIQIPEDFDYEIWRQTKKIPFVTSFINVFPKGENSFVILGYHNDYPCEWTANFSTKLKISTKAEIFKELSDLVSLRLEFWAMSIPLFDSMDKNELEKYKHLIIENVFNHGANMVTDINLFKNI